MPRQTVDQPITTREARKRLDARPEPYWRALDSGSGLGYRKGKNGGTWIARVIIGRRYKEEAIGRADDAIRPDGVTFLDFRQAAEKAKAWAGAQHRRAIGVDPQLDTSAPYTVADAVAEYLADYGRRGGKGIAQTRHVVDAHVLPALGKRRLDHLGRHHIKAWLDALADAAPRVRTGKLTKGKPRHREIDPADSDAQRRRRATANRILTVLKAALNHAHENGRVQTVDSWSAVRPFAKVGAPRVRYLDQAEALRLINACPPDLRQTVTGALLTGMRYGEIATLRVNDLNATARTISLSTSKNGKARLIHLTDEACDFFELATLGKERYALVFVREDGRSWGKSHQFRPLREACSVANITPAVGFHVLRHTYASQLIMRGVPLPVIAAQLGDSEAITAKHYAHLAPSYVADTVRSLSGTLGIAPTSDARPLPASVTP